MCISAKSLTHSFIHSLNRTLIYILDILFSMYVCAQGHSVPAWHTSNWRTTLLAFIFRSSLFCFLLSLLPCLCSFLEQQPSHAYCVCVCMFVRVSYDTPTVNEIHCYLLECVYGYARTKIYNNNRERK